MLILTRRVEEEILIGTDIRVTVLQIDGCRRCNRTPTVKVGIAAPRAVKVLRSELEAEVQQQNRASLLNPSLLSRFAPVPASTRRSGEDSPPNVS